MNIFQYAAHEEQIFEAMASENGYERKTTFFSDLSIAEAFGAKAINDTYKRVCKEWINDKVYFTEFILCLNWKSWEMAERCNNNLGKLYSDLYYKAYALAQRKWKDDNEKIEYLFRVLD